MNAPDDAIGIDLADVTESVRAGLGTSALMRERVETRLEAWQRAEEEGDPRAVLLLALCRQHGLGVEPDQERARESLRSAAEAGQPLAQVLWAVGLALDAEPPDLQGAVRWLEQASEQGMALADVWLGLLSGARPEESDQARLAHFERAAERDEPIACANLAEAYLSGDGVEVDPARGAQWARRAVDLGSPHAMLLLGDCYRFGTGVEQDPDKAIELARRAAELGLADAQCALALALDEVGSAECVRWLERAAAQGHGRALYLLAGKLYEGEDVEADPDRAETCAAAAYDALLPEAEEGDPQAALIVAHLLDEGVGTEPDEERAIAFYRLAATEPDGDFARQRLEELTTGS